MRYILYSICLYIHTTALKIISLLEKHIEDQQLQPSRHALLGRNEKNKIKHEDIDSMYNCTKPLATPTFLPTRHH